MDSLLIRELAAGGDVSIYFDITYRKTPGDPYKTARVTVPEMQRLLQIIGQTHPANMNAYEIAVDLGFEGNVLEWLDSIKGERGKDGEDGQDGKDAFELAKDYGFGGDVHDWFISLKGPQGPAGANIYQVACANGFVGSVEEFIQSLKGDRGDVGVQGEPGPRGMGVFEAAVSEGFEGSIDEWLSSLKGEQGERGLSAYDLAVLNGFEGIPTEWLESLRGEQGNKGDKGDKGEDGANGTNGVDGLSAYAQAKIAGFTGSLEEWLQSLKGDSFDPIELEELKAQLTELQKKPVPTPVSSVTNSRVIGLDDAGKWLTVASSDSTTLTIPTQGVVGWPANVELYIQQIGDGPVSVEGDGINIVAANGVKTDSVGSTLLLKRLGEDMWTVVRLT